tara:strand:- start:521 stop:640 length:120 start_codon:yes stop_codon:yes gene_type:complete
MKPPMKMPSNANDESKKKPRRGLIVKSRKIKKSNKKYEY